MARSPIGPLPPIPALRQLPPGAKLRIKCYYCGDKIPQGDFECQRCVNARRKATLRVGLIMEQPSYVYAVSVKGDSEARIKFGVAMNVVTRFRSLQTGSPVILQCLGFGTGDCNDEKAIHAILKKQRSHGEWFNRCDEAMEIVAQLKADTLREWLLARGIDNESKRRIRVLQSTIKQL